MPGHLAGGFGQGGGVLLHQRRGCHPVERHARAHKERIAADFQRPQFGNFGDVQQRLHRRVPPLLQIEHQVGATGNQHGGFPCFGQRLQGFFNGFRAKVGVPHGG